MKTERARSKSSLTKAVRLGIADRLQAVRFGFDRSPAQFAALVGVDADTVLAWERGEGVNRKALVAVADRTGASLVWLISGIAPRRHEAICEEALARHPLATAEAPAHGFTCH